MTWDAIAALVVLAFALYLSAALFRNLVRQQARERELLLNQIMHLAGRTWQPPPQLEPVQLGEEDVTMIDPAQLPDY